MVRNIVFLGLLYALGVALPTLKSTEADIATNCYSECMLALDDIDTIRTLRNIDDGFHSFLECDRDCTSRLSELSGLMQVQSRGDETITDLKPLAPRGSADKERYIPSLIKMCLATGLRECLSPLPPNREKHVERDLVERATAADESLVSVDNSSLETTDRFATTHEALQVTENKEEGRGGGWGGGGEGGKGGGGHGHSGAASIGDKWALRVGGIVFLVGWVGFVGLL